MAYPKPLLLLDVDGPLNPFRQLTKKGFLEPKVRGGGRRFEWKRHVLFPPGWDSGLPVVLSEDHGREFAKLAPLFTMIWATTWNHAANEYIAPRIGLPQLPVLEFPSDGYERDWVRNQRHRGSWKTMHIARWLDDYGWYRDEAGVSQRLPWVFIDDEVNRFDNAWLSYYWNEPSKQEPVAPRKLHRVEPSWGLSAQDFKELRKWGEAHQLTPTFPEAEGPSA